ncbi:MAG TPA: Smr/MutS family protein [Saprospiraceae bacterium]|nr:Smr/MutS family protein [Saprospiraceae bacterium]
MSFEKGQAVKLKFADEKGVIISIETDGKLKVRLAESGAELAIAPEGLEPLANPESVAPKKQAAPELPEEFSSDQLKNKGIQLAFDPIFQGDDVPEKYLVLLINDTPHEVIYQAKLSLTGEEVFKKMGKISPVSILQLGDLYYDELSDSPAMELDCCRITTDGTGARHLKSLKIKAKQFFKNIKLVPLLDRKVHLYQVFKNLEARRKEERGEDLKTYTRKQAQLQEVPKDANRKFWSHDVKAKAEFNNELDLHIDQLVDDPTELSKADILHLQIRTFEEYIEEALKLGVDRVFIIHGLGKGKLKNAIATRLIQMRFIKTFKNEWHHKYGWGATEVIFD